MSFQRYQSSTRESIDFANMDQNFFLPCVVEAISDDMSLVSVRPAVKQRKMAAGRVTEYVDYALIDEVPVGYLSSPFGYIGIRVDVGTNGILLFGDVDLQQYIDDGVTLEQESSRFNDLSDGVFFPFEFSFARRLDMVDYDISMTSINGRTGIGINDGKLDLFADVITMNGEVITSVNPLNPTPLPPNLLEPKEVRR